MAAINYAALIAAWNNVTQPPPGVTGQALTGLTAAQKLDAVRAWTVAGTVGPDIIPFHKIVNAIVPADLLLLTTLQLLQLQFVLGTGVTDASPGSTVRSVVQTIFAGKATTLGNLGALVAAVEVPGQVSWMGANGYGGGLSLNDVAAAGLS